MSTNGTQNGISFTKAYATSDGKTFGNLEDAKSHELSDLINMADGPTEVLSSILKNSAAIIDILSTTEKSRPAARKLHGGTRKPRTPKTPLTT